MMRFTSLVFVIFLSGVILLLDSCKHDPVIPSGKNGDESRALEICDTSNVTFANAVRPILQSNCVGCHNGGNPSGGLNFSSHAGIQPIALNGTLLGAVNHDAGFIPMPQGGSKLADCEIEIIRIWIEDGALNN